MPVLPAWAENLGSISLLLAVVAIVLMRLPPVQGVDHSAAFRRRRVFNWLPLGLTYAFLYMARYNLSVSKAKFGEMPNSLGHPMMGNDDFGWIFGVGTAVYGVSFLINGPLTDRFGGKFAIITGATGAAVMNLALGACAWVLVSQGPGDGREASALYALVADNFRVLFAVLYAANMYFQAFGAVAVVKVNAPWFHLRERGVFGAIFGILISLGIYFAYDWGALIVNNLPLYWVFWIPSLILAAFIAQDVLIVQDTPAKAGYADINTGDATDDDAPAMPPLKVFAMMLRNPIIMTIAFIEFCSGFLRQAIMQWFREYAKQTDIVLGLKTSFVYEHWGLLLCIAGILGGVVAGVISDHFFQSRRGPVAALLYGAMLAGAIVLSFTYTSPFVGPLMILMSMCVVGVHGMLSGTASMDFGGKKNVGVAVGIIDGFVYAGTAAMSFVYAYTLPTAELDASHHYVGACTEPANWIAWPVAMIPVAIVGLYLTTRIWTATASKSAAH